ncbi:MAG: DUF4160 domain-containing protein [Schwartzia sp.]|nr:DUF4160 domain-containing protein [Schwartzia sp. (in: firmicutes)]
MPTLDILDGIRFYILRERGTSHHKPHIHVEYGDAAASYDFDGNRLAGSSFPRSQDKKVQEWIKKYRSQLESIWEQLQAGKAPNKLEK